jgi:hypothetical protein
MRGQTQGGKVDLQLLGVAQVVDAFPAARLGEIHHALRHADAPQGLEVAGHEVLLDGVSHPMDGEFYCRGPDADASVGVNHHPVPAALVQDVELHAGGHGIPTAKLTTVIISVTLRGTWCL